MKLKEFYKLRTDFTIIGLTGRVGAGCSEIAKRLSSEDFVKSIPFTPDANLSSAENIKNKICYNFLAADNNWSPFTVINYKDVLLFHLIHEANKVSSTGFNTVIEKFVAVLCQNGKSKSGKEEWQNRIDEVDDREFLDTLKAFLNAYEDVFISELEFGCDSLNQCLSGGGKQRELYDFFFGEPFKSFSDEFYRLLNKYDAVKRTRLTHDLANNLRASACVRNYTESSIEHIYTIAETINRIIKAWKGHNPDSPKTKIIIDALKNSLELMYFKEKYSAFYMVATNKDEESREKYLKELLVSKSADWGKTEGEMLKTAEDIIKLDNAEYRTSDYKKGNFSSPDIENCIQKSDYHIFIDNLDSPDKELKKYLSFEYQLLRLVALITQPGIITPTAIERSMQVAYNAKFNSGCISRQVGAVVTDQHFSIKAIGWNDVPSGQTPCNLRSLDDLLTGSNPEVFSEYEKGEFKKEAPKYIPSYHNAELAGRNCSYCFKAFQNAIEGEKNQVHTRSLHAEENAMMQITKYGGQPLVGGNLFTTASPCELCSKKAFQLGIINIYYIDPYPGIATIHILKSGTDSKSNPQLIMFQGAVGRAFHKLYEPFMAYKDEIAILTGVSPKPSMDVTIKNLITDKSLQERLLKKLEGKSEAEKLEFIEKSLDISIKE